MIPGQSSSLCRMDNTVSRVHLRFSAAGERPLDAPMKPRGGYRVKRCKHGFRCDSEQWLCPTCRNPHSGNTRYHRNGCGASFTARLCELLRSVTVSSMRELYAAASAANLGAKPVNISRTLYDLRRDGKVVGFTVVDRETEQS